MALSVVILAAGNGKRMKSALPKVLHHLAGIPLLLHVVKTAQSLNPDNIYVVYGRNSKQATEIFSRLDVQWVLQEQPNGTGHALLQAMPNIDDSHQILVLYGDVPLIKTATLQHLLSNTQPNQLGLLTTHEGSPNNFGRIIRDEVNNIIGIIEQKDATAQQLAITEVNTGIITGSASNFRKWLQQLDNKNSQGEYYLTDVIAIAANEGVTISNLMASCNLEVRGVNDRKELNSLERYYQIGKAQELMLQGVTIMDPSRFDCRGEINVSQDVFIDINVTFCGINTIKEGTTIGPNNMLKNVTLGKNVIIHANCVIEDAIIDDNCIIGPFARIRPKTILEEGVHIGNFVELKNTQIAKFSKVNHLTYLGDAIVGTGVNVGAGTITCNYDGYQKYSTIIEDHAFIGSGTELVAPIKIGKGAYIGAGSTVTKDAPGEQLTLGRARQVTVKGWKKKTKDV